MTGLEVCANSLTSAMAAQMGGAIRVELCDNLAEGGTTPSYAQIALAKEMLEIEVWPIIRPRGGDFLYTDLEFRLMTEDVKLCRSLHCDGVVIGLLQADGTIDRERSAALIECAYPMPVAFHRAFDMSCNMQDALEVLISLGIVRVLSSGGAATALEGAAALAGLVQQAGDRITIMPGAGIHAGNIETLIKQTGARQYHASAKTSVPSKMSYRNTHAHMGSIADEYRYELTSTEKVEGIVRVLQQFS